MFIYTDGSCKSNPGPGGLAFIIYDNQTYTAFYESHSHTTNNRMELLAMLYALKYTLQYISSNDIDTSSQVANTSQDLVTEQHITTCSTAVSQQTCLEPITIYSDSKYVVQGINEWMNNWHKNHWKTAGKQDVKNPDLWQEIYIIKQQLNQHFAQACDSNSSQQASTINNYSQHISDHVQQTSTANNYSQHISDHVQQASTANNYSQHTSDHVQQTSTSCAQSCNHIVQNTTLNIKWIKAHTAAPSPNTHEWGNHLADTVASCSATNHNSCSCSQSVSIQQVNNP